MVSYHLDDPDRIEVIKIATSLNSTSRTRRKKIEAHVYIFLIRSTYVDFNMHLLPEHFSMYAYNTGKVS